MKDSHFFANLAEKLAQALPGNIQQIQKDIEKNFTAILKSAFSQLNLVTTEELKAQNKVLARSRKKIVELEKRVAALEKLINKDVQ